MNILIGNLFSLFANIVEIRFNLKYNEKQKVLTGTLIKLPIVAIGYLFLGGYAGIINCAISEIRVGVTLYKDKHNKKFYGLFAIFILLYLLPLTTQEGLRTWFLVVGTLFNFIPKWFSKDVKYIRIGNLIGDSISVIYSLCIFDIIDVTLTLVSIFGTTAALIKWQSKVCKNN